MKFTKINQQSHGGPNKFISLKDGDSVNGIFRGEIHSFYHKWVNGKGAQANHDEPGAKIRFKANFVTMEDGKLVAKIFEFPQTVYNLLADVNEEYPLETTKVKLSRRGTGTDTTYSVLPLAKEPISPAMLRSIEEVSLNILDGQTQSKADKAPSSMPGWADKGDGDPGPELPF